jgi:DNA-binding LacI/PurR family transcriptional regulator
MVFNILHHAGARRLAVMVPEVKSHSVTQRTAAAFGLPCLLIEATEQSYPAGCATLLALDPVGMGIDAIFCATDLMACGALDALRLDLGLSVPKQVQIVGVR